MDLGYVTARETTRVTQLMLEGGVQVIQLRAKKLAASEIAAIARDLARFARQLGSHFILNDHPALVPETGADGAHVGQDDMTVAAAGRSPARESWWGNPPTALDQAVAPPRTRNRTTSGSARSLPPLPSRITIPIGIQDIVTVHEQVSVPIFCIGGVKLEEPACRSPAAGATAGGDRLGNPAGFGHSWLLPGVS